MSRAFFEQVIEALVGFLPPERRGFSSRVTGRNAKVWFGAEAREHYEVQVLRRGGAHALEIGFHAEHSDTGRSEDVLARLLSAEHRWRRSLGREVEVGSFLGRAGSWRRASEIWDAADLSDDGTAVEAADRLAAYIAAFEPLRAKPPGP
jgi:hypothetical protein